MQGFRKMGKKRFFFTMGLLFASCGIFTPSRVEEPSIGAPTDSLHISSILQKTGAHFSKTPYEYEDILSSDFQFIAWDNAMYSREDMIEQLKKLKVSCGCSIAWDTCEGIGEIRTETTMTIWRRFLVKHPSDPSVTDSGKVEFSLSQSAVNTWTIVQWKENLTRSIFHP
jgi:hypothetical protein